MLRRLLRAWAGIVYRHHVTVIVVALVLTALSALSLRHLQMQVDLRSMLPDDSRAVSSNYELKESFGADMLVPRHKPYCPSMFAAQIASPGAIRSTCSPKLDHSARAPSTLVAPTATAVPWAAG